MTPGTAARREVTLRTTRGAQGEVVWAMGRHTAMDHDAVTSAAARRDANVDVAGTEGD